MHSRAPDDISRRILDRYRRSAVISFVVQWPATVCSHRSIWSIQGWLKYYFYSIASCRTIEICNMCAVRSLPFGFILAKRQKSRVHLFWTANLLTTDSSSVRDEGFGVCEWSILSWLHRPVSLFIVIISLHMIRHIWPLQAYFLESSSTTSRRSLDTSLRSLYQAPIKYQTEM